MRDVDNESEDMYEVEKILDKKTDKKGALYLVKWEGFSEAQATWEPEEHLQGVKWLMDDFNRRWSGQTPKPAAKPEPAPMPQKRSSAPLAEDIPIKKPDIKTSEPEPTIFLPPNLIQDTEDSPKSAPKQASKPKVKLAPKPKPRQAPKVASKAPTVAPTPADSPSVPPGLRVIRGNLSLDVAVKILGCRQQGTGIEYAVQFKRRPDVVIMPQICSHEELRQNAPWLLSQYLLEAAKVEEGRLCDTTS